MNVITFSSLGFILLSSSLGFFDQHPINWLCVHSPSLIKVALPVLSGTLFLLKPFPLLKCTRKYFRVTCSTTVAGLQWVINNLRFLADLIPILDT